MEFKQLLFIIILLTVYWEKVQSISYLVYRGSQCNDSIIGYGTLDIGERYPIYSNYKYYGIVSSLDGFLYMASDNTGWSEYFNDYQVKIINGMCYSYLSYSFKFDYEEKRITENETGTIYFGNTHRCPNDRYPTYIVKQKEKFVPFIYSLVTRDFEGVPFGNLLEIYNGCQNRCECPYLLNDIIYTEPETVSIKFKYVENMLEVNISGCSQFRYNRISSFSEDGVEDPVINSSNCTFNLYNPSKNINIQSIWNDGDVFKGSNVSSSFIIPPTTKLTRTTNQSAFIELDPNFIQSIDGIQDLLIDGISNSMVYNKSSGIALNGLEPWRGYSINISVSKDNITGYHPLYLATFDLAIDNFTIVYNPRSINIKYNPTDPYNSSCTLYKVIVENSKQFFSPQNNNTIMIDGLIPDLEYEMKIVLNLVVNNHTTRYQVVNSFSFSTTPDTSTPTPTQTNTPPFQSSSSLEEEPKSSSEFNSESPSCLSLSYSYIYLKLYLFISFLTILFGI